MSQIPGTIGDQRTLVILINGIDTVARAQDVFFGNRIHSLDHFYRKCSFGKLRFFGEVVEVQMSMPSTCDLPEIANRASDAAAAAGVDLELYDRRAYVGAFPCPMYGIGALGQGMKTPGGRRYGQIWLKGIGNWNHEMGHSLGMAHACTYNPYYEYGDQTDQMGNGGGREMNGPHKVQMGWVEGVRDVAEAGIYEIAPLEVDIPAVQVLRIQKPGTDEYYYVSYRQPIGDYDGSFWPGFVAGVSIHVWKQPLDNFGAGGVTRFVDTKPGSSYGFGDGPLVDGGRWLENGLLIEQLMHSPGESGSCTVRVAFGETPPVPPPPEPAFSISPLRATLRAGEGLQFAASRPVDNWSLSGPGMLSQTGFYRAPSPISRKSNATVSAMAGAQKAAAIVSLMKGRG